MLYEVKCGWKEVDCYSSFLIGGDDEEELRRTIYQMSGFFPLEDGRIQYMQYPDVIISIVKLI